MTLPSAFTRFVVACGIGLSSASLISCSSPPKQPEPRPQAAPIAESAAPGSNEPLLSPAPLTDMPVLAPNTYGTQAKVVAMAKALADRHRLATDWVVSVLSQAKYVPEVARLIMPAAKPNIKNWSIYRTRFIEPIRIRKGRTFWAQEQDTLQKAARQFGVPADIIAGIIGVETIYGQQTGNFRVLDALSTLSLDFPSGRQDRSGFFQNELGEFLRLCAEQGRDPSRVLGSYAGAMGWPQFMPSSVRQYAIDFDGDGKIDLQNSTADVIGSVAHFLSRHGWRAGSPTHFSVRPPNNQEALTRLLLPDVRPSFTSSEMTLAGALLDDVGQQYGGLLALVKLENGDASPSYVAGTENFYAITRYNHSSYYAMAVIELAKAVSSP